jgi:hypothetical protein
MKWPHGKRLSIFVSEIGTDLAYGLSVNAGTWSKNGRTLKKSDIERDAQSVELKSSLKSLKNSVAACFLALGMIKSLAESDK